MQRSGNKGFTIVEMAVTMAIAGLIAAIATMNYRFVTNRSRQSQAKAALGSAYDVMKNYASEFTGYSARFDSIGYQPEGELTYRIGFGGDAFPATPPGAPTGTSTCIVTYPITAADCAIGYKITWTSAPSAQGIMVFPVDRPSESSFKVHALGRINSVTVDSWAIDQDKNLVNRTSGL